MNIGNTEGVGGAGRIDGPQKIGRILPPASLAHAAAADKLELSAHGKITSDALALPSVRAERVEEVRKLIQTGRFDTDARLGLALDRFAAEQRDILDE